jgi:MFS family permease
VSQSVPTSSSLAVPLDERFIVVITSVGHALCHIAELIFAGAMVKIMIEFGLEPHEATALGLLGFILMGAGALPTGYLTDRLGTKKLLLTYFVATGLSALAIAVSTGPWLFFLAITALGASISIYHPVGVAMISLGVNAKGRAMGIHGVAGSVGVALGPFLGFVFAEWGIWRLAYLIVAGIAALGAVLLCLAPRRVPSDADSPLRFGPNPSPPAPLTNGERGEEGPAPLPNGQRGEEGPTVPTNGKRETRELSPPSLSGKGDGGLGSSSWRRYLPVMLLLFVMMLGGINYRSLMTALPEFLRSSSEAAVLGKGGLIILLSLIAGGFGQYFGGVLGDRLGPGIVYLFLVILLSASALVMSTLEGSLLALPMACVIAVFLFGQQPVENTLLAEATSNERRGMSYGMKFALTFGVGALGAQIVGFIWTETKTLGPAFYVIALGAALMAVCLFLFTRMTTRQPLAVPASAKEEQPWPADSSQPSPVS